MSSNAWREFDPPDKGLESGETVVWSGKAGVEFVLIFCGGCLPLATVFMAFPIVLFFGEQLGAYVLVAIGIVILYLFALMIRRKMTRYFLTSARLLEVRAGIINAEIRLENLRGLSPDSFMTAKLSHDEGAYDYYNIDIRDPVQDTTIHMTSMREDVLDVLRGLGEPQKST